MNCYFIDTHAHLFADEFRNDIAEVVQRATTQNVQRIILPSIDSKSYNELIALSNQLPKQCFPAIGLHPTSVKEDYITELDFVKEQLQQQQFIAIGEVGIDCYWSMEYINEQIDAFEQQLELAISYQLPVIIHSRESYSYIFASLDKFQNKKLRGVFHSFSGTVDDYHKIKTLGDFKVGIGGVVTFKNSTLPKLIEQVDINDIVLETDAPYLTPAPYRGKRNESAYIPIIAQRIGEIKKLTTEEVARTTTANALQLFWKE